MAGGIADLGIEAGGQNDADARSGGQHGPGRGGQAAGDLLIELAERIAQMPVECDFAGEVVLEGLAQSGGRRQGGTGQLFELGHLGIGIAEHKQPEFLGQDVVFAGQKLAR